MRIIDKKTTFGIIISVRGFFNPKLAEGVRRDAVALMDRLGVNYVITDTSATPSGSIETVSDAKVCAELFKKHRDDIDGIIIMLPNFGDEQAVVETLRLASLNVPVLIQASSDKKTELGLDQRRDAFCGKLSVCNNLYQYGIKFTDTTTHTCDAGGAQFENDVKKFASVCRTVKGLKNARLGLIGTRPGAFQTVRFSEKLLQRSGITVVPVDLSQIIADAGKVSASEGDFKNKSDEIRAYSKIEPVEDAVFARSVQLAVAVDRFMSENALDGSAVQCWDSIENNYGCATCLMMSMMGEKLFPSACEADMAGTVSMYALLLASRNAPGFLDWNNNYDDERDVCINIHCSNYPKSFINAEPVVGYLDVLSRQIAKEKCFGAVKGRVAPGDMTFFRISTDDTRGCIKAYVGEGEFLDATALKMDGGVALCKVKGLQKLMKVACANGFEHHVAMVRSHVAAAVYEATAKYLDWKVYYHNMPDE